MKQATGVTLPITKESEVSGCKISVGKTAALNATGREIDYGALNSDGFYIFTEGSDVFIVGANDRGTLYGVYEFLERFAGVRFLTSDHTYVPALDSLGVHQMMIQEVPVFRMRNYYNYGVANDYAFAVRMRQYSDYICGGTDASKYGYESEWSTSLPNHIHNSMYWVPEEKYKEKHPEFYADYTNPGNKYNELCYTNGITDDGEVDETMEESVLKAALESFIEQIESQPNAKFFMLGKMDDGNSYCTCERCQKSDAKYGGKSGTTVVFMNALIREVKKWAQENDIDREINLVFFAYQYTEQPPVVQNEDGSYSPVSDKVILDDNLFVRIAPIGANYAVSFSDEAQLEFYKKIFNGWKAVTHNFMVWDYNVNYQEYFWYFPNLSYFKENLLYYRDLGVVYLMNQSSHNEPANWQADLKLYVAAKLYWHPEREVTDIVNEFVTLHYGETAAPYVLEFIEYMENYFAHKVNGGLEIRVNSLSANSEYLASSTYPLGFLEKAESILERGMQAVEDDETLSSAERSRILTELTKVLITPQRMILRDYDAYYIENKENFARAFFDNCDRAGVLRINENTMVDDAKATYGI